MITTALLPIRNMVGTDWDKLDNGLWLTGSSDTHIPFENVLSDKIITYLMNLELNILSYTTHYQQFFFRVVGYGAYTFNAYPEGVRVLDQIDELVLELSVRIDEKRFAIVDKHEALRMIAQLMLDSIPQYLFHRTDFDGKKFYDDILPIIKPIADGTRTFQDEEFPM